MLSFMSRTQVTAFYEYYEGLQEGWDGPALLVFSDGNKVIARLDRNGLRPARYWETTDGMVYVASEVLHLADDFLVGPFGLQHIKQLVADLSKCILHAFDVSVGVITDVCARPFVS